MHACPHAHILIESLHGGDDRNGEKSSRLVIIIEKDNKRMVAGAPISAIKRLVFVINR